MNFRTRFLLISTLSFFVVELIARMFDFYSKYVYYDDISHLLFGVSLYAFFKLMCNLKVQTILILYTLIAFFWEFIEKIGDQLFEQPDYLLDYFFFDGFFDVIFGYLGILMIHYYYERKIK